MERKPYGRGAMAIHGVEREASDLNTWKGVTNPFAFAPEHKV